MLKVNVHPAKRITDGSRVNLTRRRRRSRVRNAKSANAEALVLSVPPNRDYRALRAAKVPKCTVLCNEWMRKEEDVASVLVDE